MRFITLELAKAHLVVEHDKDDKYIEHLITATEQAVENYLERPLDECMIGGYLPADVQHGILLHIGSLYANRESQVFATPSLLPATVMLLQPHKKYR